MRTYDAVSGRFLQPDPLGLRAGDTNLFRYVGSNPINATDPTGQTAFSKDPIGFAAGDANLYRYVGSPNATASGIYWLSGTDEHQQLKIPYIPSPDWSKNLVVQESDACHGFCKFAGAGGVESLTSAWIAKAAKARAAAALAAEGAGAATAGSTGAVTLGEIAPALADDAMINLGSVARNVVSPPGGRSYWFRFGDVVKHLTPQQVRTVIGDLASAGTEQGCKVIRVAKEPSRLVPRPPSNAADIGEFICDEGVDIIQNIDLLK